MSATVNALEIRNLRAGYGRYDVLRDVDLHVAPGEAVGLLVQTGRARRRSSEP